jgi:hypothetical protein
MSTMMNITDPSVIYAIPTIDDLPSDTLPDPEGYYAGQEEYGYNRKDSDHDHYDDQDAYEPDVFSYDSY